ncbi:MAG: isoprenylcysteine carboxylmethyltransferase family protein [Gammaproteobacteria bacterium]|jgi:protein-S-isoprenylcysteine O-methyltransferase Ste14|nr:isoprenylcysteine carboxylmethyltransferase family protein [Gammaproteobacteria bacterium]MBP6053407.1 isoprenylcysteine carboxylmethyltransferase family protein [Pseudomonadales bacterium]MBK6585188.1 isoprenylcysteine carboxylmethyltransferase family protein [Gammaproteobacteria bacterium]MBK7169065.1 isoprenylcysteine carboxylmethyltransferase family protein [Gammaproteobacteria bacterium]MBK7520089.1 isoprenylcysteine carboxylmethyltransferase family protein [Gammaproteobacteria bacteriu
MELKLPPPLVALVLCALMWGIDHALPVGRVQTAVQGLLALVLVCLGIGVSVSGMLAFRAARTTVDPRNPGKATQLVAGGIYRLSRNPMYVGLLCTITAWAIYLGSPWGLPALPLYVWYVTRFQILPEEAALHRLFGASYTAYCARVRRWI